MSIKTVETGLPFFSNIQRQGRYRGYFNFYSQEWICPKNRLPSFQFYGTESATTLVSLDLINVETEASSSYLAHWVANGSTLQVDVERYYFYPGDVAVTAITPARYYLYAKDDVGAEWWSEVFTVTNLEE